jgi:hypothetical protein
MRWTYNLGNTTFRGTNLVGTSLRIARWVGPDGQPENLIFHQQAKRNVDGSQSIHVFCRVSEAITNSESQN